MSSGAYIFLPLAVMSDVAESFGKMADDVKKAGEDKRRLAEAFQQTTQQINAMKNALNKKVYVAEPGSNQGQSVSLKGISTEGKDDSITEFSVDDLFLAEVDSKTEKITYIVFDYSEVLALSNARNSNEYKKLSLASEINKQVMVLPVDAQTKKKVTEFSDVMNKMLDDPSVDFDYFNSHILKRFDELKLICERVGVRTDSDEWLEYCSLCAMVGIVPQSLTGQALEMKIDELRKKALVNNYVSAARKALYETLEELDLKIINEYELEEIPGFIVGESESAGYKFFVSEDNSNFVFEMIEEKTAQPQEKAMMCVKRRRIAKIMKEKGYPLELVAENDEAVVSAMQATEKTNKRDEKVDNARRRRAVAGKKPKVKMMGG